MLLILLCAVGVAVLVLAAGFIAMRRRARQANKAEYYVEQVNPAYSIKEMMEDAPRDEEETTTTAAIAPDSEGDAGDRGGLKSKHTCDIDELNTTHETHQDSSVGSDSPARRSSASSAKSGQSSSNNSKILGGRILGVRKSAASDLPASDRLNDSATDGRSVAGESESDFTVNTEAGDSLALQSISGYQLQPTSTGGVGTNLNDPSRRHPRILSTSHPSPAAQAFAPTESFQRERRVSLQKDMLVSSWSSGGGSSNNIRVSSSSPISSSIRMLPQHNHHQHGPPSQSDSVLTPSYFVAAEEKDLPQKRSRKPPLGLQVSGSSRGNRHSYQPHVEEGENEDEDDTDYDGSVSVSVDESGSVFTEEGRPTASPSASGNASNGFSSSGGGSGPSASTPPQTPPSATARNRFLGPPRPSPGNIV
jgi:hypothetical protein